ncbi:hypothetical protein [Burkholderia gladioli]|uniref:hypothetical protein n=1 Tax=Burkholderia gladioli TaxID=28095 RepID=UPI00163EA118|nr:hypothetical protein [Burkholderia gladioli]
MPKKFGEIDVTEILGYEGAETEKIARYECIMQHRTIEAMNGLSLRLDGIVTELNDATSNLKVVAIQLNGVTQAIYRVGQLAQDKANEAIEAAANAGRNLLSASPIPAGHRTISNISGKMTPTRLSRDRRSRYT